MGAYIAIFMMYYTWKQEPEPWIAALLSCAYWIGGLSAPFYPGADWTDPEFGTGRPQLYLFSSMIVVTWLGYWFIRDAAKGRKRAVE